MAQVETVEEVIHFLDSNKGNEVMLEITRGDDIYRLRGVPREDPPEGQGSLGIALTRTAIVSYPLIASINMGMQSAYDLTVLMVVSLFGILKDLVTGGEVTADVAGPVGIIVLTNQVTEMGLAYLLQFAAVLSINLAIINILPIPALDGGSDFFLNNRKNKKKTSIAQTGRDNSYDWFLFIDRLNVFSNHRRLF